jgi:chorismate dehydratase
VVLEKTLNISAVSYLNTKPFIYGLQNSGFLAPFILREVNPAECARNLLDDTSDIALVPVAILPQLKEYRILSKYCIGANGPVESVMLFSQVPINQIKTIVLDYQSRSSVYLLKFLAENYWKVNPKWVESKAGYEQEVTGTTAALIIGDRALEFKDDYKYSYDLADQWKEHTGLPFVFAIWVTLKPLPEPMITAFEKAIDFGVKQIDKVITTIENKGLIDLRKYFNKYISFDFGEDKQEALSKFLAYIKEKEAKKA